jgi:hypothetical protein
MLLTARTAEEGLMSAWQAYQANAALPGTPHHGVGLVTQLALLANASLW